MPYWRRKTDRRYDALARSLFFGTSVFGVVVGEWSFLRLLGL